MSSHQDKLIVWVITTESQKEQEVQQAIARGELRQLPIRATIFDSEPDELQTSQEVPHIVMLAMPSQTINFERIHKARLKFTRSIICVLAQGISGLQIIEALRIGAHDVILRNTESMRALPERLIHCYRLVQKKFPHESTIPQRAQSPYVGKTIDTIRSQVPNIINSAITTIYIEGETGTGKEVVADLFQSELSNDVPFIKVNCGAIAPNLMESEFFGHIKGSFTGAVANKTGLIEKASGGFLFLDEVANLTREAQAALLRAIESQEVIRVGENQPRPVKVRFISATNENLAELVESGKFRQDLWQRLTEKVIMLKPLRERKSEINDIITAIATNMEGGPYTVTATVREVLASLPWQKGNIRQLRNCLRAMTEFQLDGILDLQAIPTNILQQMGQPMDLESEFADQSQAPESSQNQLTLSWTPGEKPSFDDLSDQLLIKMLERRIKENGRLSLRKLALSMGMVRNTLSNRIKTLAEKNMLDDAHWIDLVGKS